jgi:hypothetical protein
MQALMQALMWAWEQRAIYELRVCKFNDIVSLNV